MGPEPESESESDRWLSVAEKLLAANDLIGSRRFAERALESDPLTPSDRADRIIAVADVILASQSRIDSQPDPYSILNSTPGSDSSSILSNYRRLSRLLNPNSNRLPFAARALQLVSDAYSTLSGPGKGSDSARTDDQGFWTACPSCCHLHLYERVYAGMVLKCRKCAKGFRADELASAPPVVEGTDMYYCTWGFFPLGLGDPQQPTPPKSAPVANTGRLKRMAGKKKNAGSSWNGGIDINRGVDDGGEYDGDDVVEVEMD